MKCKAGNHAATCASLDTAIISVDVASSAWVLPASVRSAKMSGIELNRQFVQPPLAMLALGVGRKGMRGDQGQEFHSVLDTIFVDCYLASPAMPSIFSHAGALAGC